MNKIYKILIVGFLIFGCKNKNANKKITEEKVVFNQDLADELKRMAEVDQIAAYIPQGDYKKMTEAQWNSFKDSVFTTHQKRLKQIFDKNGFVGFDLAGKEGSQNFWLMVQHSDHNSDFQKEILEKMKIEVENDNASPSNYAFLVDRVSINTGKEQVYGTQFTYNELGQAYPKNMSDTIGINKRRKIVGLKPIIERMNEMTTSHFIMNKSYFNKKGISEPKLYKSE
ncbi:DUF6624 domain-containing protein [uncultured Psychroserpens sp.]|uniref:DUF6624 domain-containing protein n=1 Tax=uncultured Psychroserpens sp. TaxID=255436 RepID=UPI00262F84EB|nr:DUF6624 domain-containing protein [uncultured Psychroserpens sp.]